MFEETLKLVRALPDEEKETRQKLEELLRELEAHWREARRLPEAADFRIYGAAD